MSELCLTPIRLRSGIWEAKVSGARGHATPQLKVMYLDQPVEAVELTEATEPGTWDLRIDIPRDAICDGVQTFVICDAEDDTRLGVFTLIAGDAVPDDLRVEVELLRAELDMLKRAFRRHCLETL